ncbi:MAG: (p)ppGpp synthetase [Tissierellia bacterium]|nr:(p)ppGpp synthetase [Tissierellia bacterium]
MELELFDKISGAVEILGKEYHRTQEVCSRLEAFFLYHFKDEDSFLSINSRVKSENSFKEKVIRNNLYLKYDSPQELYENMQDLIGLRMECRFSEDESRLFEALRKKFTEGDADGFSSIPGDQHVFLNVESPQPHLQKNGFEIYKMDGFYMGEGGRVNFELQIKSLVNVFWGEIDHRVLYKNYNYMITENFFRDIMHSIKDNLSMIDRQLMILYDHVNNMEISGKLSFESRDHVKLLLSKGIHDVFTSSIHEGLGFVINFNYLSDVLVDYLFYKCGVDEEMDYGACFISLINRLRDLDKDDLDLYTPFPEDEELKLYTDFSRELGQMIYGNINKVFGWNLFFKMLDCIESDPIAEEIASFSEYVEHILRKRIQSCLTVQLSYGERKHIEDRVLCALLNNLKGNPTLQNLLDKVFDKKVLEFKQLFRNIENFKDYQRNEVRILYSINHLK